MPELPDVVVYIECLESRIVGQPLNRLRIKSPFLLRSFETPPSETHGKRITGIRRMGKRIVFELEDDLFIVLHLMVAGRLRWKNKPNVAIPGRVGLCAWDLPHATLVLTEAGKQRRASLHVERGEENLAHHDRGGLEPLDCAEEAFIAQLRSCNHTLKRSLTDPRLFSGIGNAYSDEILHRAQLSPVAMSQKLRDRDASRLFAATREALIAWTDRLRDETGEGFPEKVTAFRPEMAVHGKYREPCPVCGDPVQRIVYASRETNYCATCQTGGKVLADRALSRLLKKDWPKTLAELEERRSR